MLPTANSGYAEINYALWPVHDEDAYTGPFTVSASAPAPLVTATTYDPATPYQGALSLVQDLGNARLLTMEGDGHTAYGGNSTCIDSATETYLVTGAVPAAGTVCHQEVPFEPLGSVLVGTGAGSPLAASGAIGALVGSRR